MLVDDRPRYPMTFIVQLKMTGRIDQVAFDASITEALKRHPLLTAVVGPGKRGKDSWIAASNPGPHVDWGELDTPLDFISGEFLDIRKEVGLRLFIRHDEQRAVITSQFHHAACDGIGSYQYLGDLLYEYASRMGDTETPPPIALDPLRLKNRGLASYDANNYRAPDGRYASYWRPALDYLTKTSVMLKPEQSKPRDFKRPFPGIQSHVFDRDEHKRLRLAAQARGQILNDMLLEKLFESLHRWDRQQRTLPIRKSLAVMMPLNLREPSDNDISCCNVVGHSFVSRTWKDLQNREKFRTELANELLQIKRDRHRIPFMHVLAGAHQYYPWLLKPAISMVRCRAAAILSNTGDPTKQFHAKFPRENGLVRCGNLLLDDVAGVPPLRPGTNATISIFTYRRRLKICLRCDPNQFSETDTRALLNSYVDSLCAEIN